MSNQTHRVLELIRRFNKNEKVCIEQLKNEFLWENKSDKTIRRDLDIIKQVFPETFHRIQGEKGCYKALTKSLFENIISAEQLSLLVQTFNIANRSNLFANLHINTSDRAILQKQIRETKDIYLFINKPYENHSGDAALFKKLEQAIYHGKELRITYRVSGKSQEHIVKPYQIVFINENFYLACEVDRPEYQFSPYRIAQITSTEFTGKTFYKNREIASFIKEMQTPMAKYQLNYRECLLRVKVQVSPRKAHYFKTKKYLPSQSIIEEKHDGTLILSYIVTQEDEILDLVKRWIPHMHVISPNSLQKKIREDLEGYLKK